jgi:hypothetical protein
LIVFRTSAKDRSAGIVSYKGSFDCATASRGEAATPLRMTAL